MNDTLPVLTHPSGSQRSGEVVLNIDSLWKKYGDLVAVNNLTLQVHRGEIYGFLGPNGAGKTTTIRMALGLIAPTGGKVSILGNNVLEHRGVSLARVGAMIESPALHLYLSGRDNLRAVGKILGGVSEKRIDTILELVGLLGRDRDRVKTYSLGMKQRLGVATALLNNPDLLILDEPANGLDPAGIVEMRDLLRTLSEEGKTVFLSSHVLTEVQQICSRVAIINKGRLIVESTINDLTSSNGQFTVVVDNAGNIVKLLQAQPWGTQAHIDVHGHLVTNAPNNRGRDLISFLVQNNATPDSVYAREESLEEVFLRLTDNGGEVR